MPARIEFHTGVADPVDYTCRLLRKAQRSGARVLVLGPPATLATLDQALWTFEPQAFVPHARLGHGAMPSLARTPLWLAESVAEADAESPQALPRIVVSLQANVPADAARFDRIIEIVGDDDDARRSGRARWRHYDEQGATPEHVAVPRGQRADPDGNEV